MVRPGVRRGEAAAHQLLPGKVGNLRRVDKNAALRCTTKHTTEGLDKLLALPEFSDLESLFVHRLDIDDRHWAVLARLKNFRSVNYCDLAKVTCKGIGQLQACPDFESVTFLGNMPISPEALVEMRSFPKLFYLNYSVGRWTPGHLDALDDLKLTMLMLGNTGIDDTSAARLAKMTTLKRLDIPANPLTDKGLAHFKSLTALTEINVKNTQVTAEGIADFRKALPNCKIVWNMK